ncbi:MAG TPA: folylpolyglutamate synthase/dihydrofolate synthase family protein [Elusimicrobiota bacterium]|nr:folylpolyglutamate synthase/dihydrofolate synthase family protein [Elusimicrobiota bacterium]
MHYSEALKVLEARRETRVDLGLARVRRVLAALRNPQEAFLSFHVAGTNGKGSICAMLESVLRRAGYKTGLYVSPHLWSVRERIRVNGRMISPAAFGRAVGDVLAAEKKTRTRLTYFELATCAAFLYFRDQGVRVAVLETGLGGRLDATNVVRRPLACVISSIDFDHMDFLGPTLRHIAREKAGIIKRGRPVVCPRLAPAALSVVRRRATVLRAPLRVAAKPWRVARVLWRGDRQELADASGRRILIGILGARQGMNAALTRAALDAAKAELPVPESAWRQGMRSARWPLRFDVRRAGRRTIILDGAHNPEAARCLAETWRASPWSRGRVRWIVGILRDKDARGVVKALAPALQDVVVCAPPSPRAMAPEDLAAVVRSAAPKARLALAPDVAAALREWRRESDAPPTAVVCGSFYLAAQAARALGVLHREPPR